MASHPGARYFHGRHPAPTQVPALLKFADAVDRFSERSGRLLGWLSLLMVLVGSYNAIVRYLDKYSGLGLSSNTYIELQWYLFSAMFLLGAAYTLKKDAHVRVDVLTMRLSPRGRAWVDVAGIVLFLVPFCLMMLWVCYPAVQNSIAVREMSPDPGGLPRWPIKAVIPVAFILLLVQGLALLARRVAFLVDHGRKVAAPDAGEHLGGGHV